MVDPLRIEAVRWFVGCLWPRASLSMVFSADLLWPFLCWMPNHDCVKHQTYRVSFMCARHDHDDRLMHHTWSLDVFFLKWSGCFVSIWLIPNSVVLGVVVWENKRVGSTSDVCPIASFVQGEGGVRDGAPAKDERRNDPAEWRLPRIVTLEELQASAGHPTVRAPLHDAHGRRECDREGCSEGEIADTTEVFDALTWLHVDLKRPCAMILLEFKPNLLLACLRWWMLSL